MKLTIANIYLLTTCAGIFVEAGLENKVFKLDRYEICDKPPKSPFKWGEIYLDNAGRQTLINSKLEVLRDVLKVKMAMQLTRCSNRESLDSCEKFSTLKAKDGCMLFGQQSGTIFYKYSVSFTPHYKCPFIKGHYLQVNGSLDPQQFNFFPLEQWYWKMKSNIDDYYTNEHLFSVCIEGQVVFSRQ